MKPPLDEAGILSIERPDKALWTYYLLRCLVIPPLFPIEVSQGPWQRLLRIADVRVESGALRAAWLCRRA